MAANDHLRVNRALPTSGTCLGTKILGYLLTLIKGCYLQLRFKIIIDLFKDKYFSSEAALSLQLESKHVLPHQILDFWGTHRLRHRNHHRRLFREQSRLSLHLISANSI